MKFFVCEHCGNIIAYVKDSGVPVMCCGQKMKEIIMINIKFQKFTKNTCKI